MVRRLLVAEARFGVCLLRDTWGAAGGDKWVVPGAVGCVGLEPVCVPGALAVPDLVVVVGLLGLRRGAGWSGPEALEGGVPAPVTGGVPPPVSGGVPPPGGTLPPGGVPPFDGGLLAGGRLPPGGVRGPPGGAPPLGGVLPPADPPHPTPAHGRGLQFIVHAGGPQFTVHGEGLFGVQPVCAGLVFPIPLF